LAPKITKLKCNWRKLYKALLYEKGECEILIKLTTGDEIDHSNKRLRTPDPERRKITI